MVRTGDHKQLEILELKVVVRLEMLLGATF